MMHHNCKKLAMAVLCIAVAVESHAAGDQFAGMDRTKFHIGAYFLRDWVLWDGNGDSRIRDFIDCGHDMLIMADNWDPGIKMFERYGLPVIITGVLPAGIFGPKVKNVDEITNEDYDEAVRTNFIDNACICGVDVRDEPTAAAFSHLAELVDHFDTLFTNKFPFVNLLPNYCDYLKVPTYKEYIDAYCDSFPTLDYICYDHYMYETKSVGGFLRNLAIVADACLRTGRSLWIVPQVGAEHADRRPLASDQLRYQAFASMAFGAEVIFWGCYMQGWYGYMPLSSSGEKQEVYYSLKEVNTDIRRLADDYMKFRRVETWCVGFGTTNWLTAADETAYTTVHIADSFDWGDFADVHAEDGGPILAAALESRSGDGEKALFVMAADDPNALAQRRRRVLIDISAAEDADGQMRVFRVAGSSAAIAPEVAGNGVIALSLKSNEAALIEIVNPSVQSHEAVCQDADMFDDAWRSVAVSEDAGILLNMPAESTAADERTATTPTAFDDLWRSCAVSPLIDEVLLGRERFRIILK